MNKIWRVACTEYLNSVRSKAFIISVLAMPIFVVGGILIQTALRDRTDTKDRRFAVVDRTGELYPALAAEAAERNRADIFDQTSGKKGAKIRPAFIPEEFHPTGSDPGRVDVVLSERVRQKKLFAFVIIERDAIAAGDGGSDSISYYTQSPTYAELPAWIERVLNEEIKKRRFAAANVDQSLVRKLGARVPLKRLGLANVSPTGKVVAAKRENQLATFAIPFGSLFLLFILVITSAPTLLNTVLEEKTQKIAEVLVSAVPPFHLMLGKLMGAVFISLTLSVFYLGAVLGVLWKFHLLALVPPWHIAWFLLFQLLALLIFGSIFSAVGAACSEIRDAQSMMFPAMLFVIVPLFIWMPVLQSPSSAFARIMSLIPPFTPMLMMLRISVPPGPPWWEVLLGVILTVGFMLCCVWGSAKIFRIGILAQGQTPSIPRLISWLWSK